MKTLVFGVVAFAAISFASCGNKAATSEETVDTTAVEVVEEVAEVAVDSAAAVVADSLAADSVVAE